MLPLGQSPALPLPSWSANMPPQQDDVVKLSSLLDDTFISTDESDYNYEVPSESSVGDLNEGEWEADSSDSDYMFEVSSEEGAGEQREDEVDKSLPVQEETATWGESEFFLPDHMYVYKARILPALSLVQVF